MSRDDLGSPRASRRASSRPAAGAEVRAGRMSVERDRIDAAHPAARPRVCSNAYLEAVASAERSAVYTALENPLRLVSLVH